ncbi:MAG: TetR/AcrR family transcriptional regulator [Microthrixaceae bacterium]|nr:TetR/AcrR family transcriptional regulator [Microthrixaceae bacterium]
METRAEILDAAWRLARRDGLASIAMRELGREVGLRAQSLYGYFDSKAELYDAMFMQGQEQFAQLAQRWPTDLGATENPRESFKALIHEFAGFCVEDPVRYQLLFQRVIPEWAPSAESYALAEERLAQLQAGLAGVGIHSDGAVDLWTAVMTGLTDQQISNDPGGDRWIRLVDEAVDMFFDHFATDSTSRESEIDGINARGNRESAARSSGRG